jgi:hypothetical protein
MRAPRLLLHKLQLGRRGDERFLARFGQKLMDRPPPDLAVVERVIIHHPDKTVGPSPRASGIECATASSRWVQAVRTL